MKRRGLKIAVGIIFILSLLVSSVSACTCSQHEHSALVDVSSQHSHQHEASHHEHAVESSTIISDSLTGDECCCVQPAPKATAKSETIRPEGKIVATTSRLNAIKTEFTLIADVEIRDFTHSRFHTDPPYNLSPGRAPPRL